MPLIRTTLTVETDLKTILKESWGIIRPHLPVMSLIWAVFYIPTNIFILIRSGDMLRNLSSGSSGVILLMIILNLLGTIPNIALALLVGRKGSDDYNALVAESFKSLPLYITTTLSMLLSMLPLMFSGIIIASLIITVLEKTGASQLLQIYIALPVIVAACALALIRYFSTVNFYLVRGIRNLRAARYSKILFRGNRKMILFFFGICSLLPLALNFAGLYLFESEGVNILTGFILGYYMFVSSGFFAGLFLYVNENEGAEKIGDEN